jgi:cation:H+ antiporter
MAFSPALNAVIFGTAGVVVWIAGAKLARYAKALSDRFGGRQATVGIVLLGGVVSLPEMATSVSASFLGNARFAINILLGGISVTMVIVAIVDALVGWEPLSVDIAHPIVLLQGVFVLFLLSVAAAGIVAGDVEIAGIGAGVWTISLLLLYLLFILLINRYEKSDGWFPRRVVADDSETPDAKKEIDPTPPGVLALKTVGASASIIVSSVILAVTGDTLAVQTGLGASFFGMVLGGIATSLPELSTTLAAVRLKQYEMAFGDAFGTNLFSIMLLFFADVVYPEQPILNEAGRFSLFAILLAVAITAVYLAGIILRRNFSILRMGMDSFLVILLYAIGLVVLFHLR